MNDDTDTRPDGDAEQEPQQEPNPVPDQEPNSEPDQEPNSEPDQEPNSEPDQEPNSEPDQEPDAEGTSGEDASAEANGDETGAGSEVERGAEPASDAETPSESADAGRDVRQYAVWGAFAIASLLSVIAALRLYLSVDQLVSVWIAPEYEPVFRAAFNLVVLLLAGYATFALANRMNE